MGERTILLTLAYDGTDFHGWQIQSRDRTVQGELEAALQRLHGDRVITCAAGRTDSGVHADGQRVSFRSTMDSIPAHTFREAINGLLPYDVRVLESRLVPDGFHARCDALTRTYRYYLLVSPVQVPRYRNYAHRVSRTPDLAMLNRMAAQLVGEHDFSSFGVPTVDGGHCIRRVDSAAFYPRPPFVVFEITANAFLWKMVRSIVGTILACEPCGVSHFADILRAADRSRARVAAPGRGLVLYKVRYHESLGIS